MKKMIFVLLLSFTYCIANAQEYKYAGCIIEQKTSKSNGMVWENDSLKITFAPTDYFWEVKIENKTTEKAVCNWDNTLFIMNKTSSGIVFDNTIGLDKNNPKGISTIAYKTEITKKIFPVENWLNNGIYEVFKKKYITRDGNMTIRIIIPISFGEKSKDYEFSFNISVAPKK